MLSSRSHEKKVAWLELITLAVMKKDAAATEDDINLILGVRSRWPWERREPSERKHDVQGPALQEADCMLARRSRDTCLSVLKTNHSAAIGHVHACDTARIDRTCQA